MKVFILRTADIPCGQGMLIIAAENKHQAYQIALQNKVNITIDSDGRRSRTFANRFNHSSINRL